MGAANFLAAVDFQSAGLGRRGYKGVMRAHIVGAVVAMLLVGCGQTVTGHIDALQEGGARHAHDTMPSPQRQAELYPMAEPDGLDLRSRLREDQHGRALLDAGEGAVPELVRLLGDPERRTLAAVFLAEIGG